MSRHPSYTGPSPELLAAQERLLVLRAEYAQTKKKANAPRPRPAADSSAEHQSAAEPQLDWARLIKDLPPHLGWESSAVTEALRTVGRTFSLSHGQVADRPRWGQAESLPYGVGDGDAVGRTFSLSTGQVTDRPRRGQAESLPYGIGDSDRNWERGEIRLYPSLGLGMLRRKKTASGRIWLLLRAVDAQGQGWIALERARKLLAQPNAPLKICGARHFRNLIKQGEGIFWENRGQRLWLRSLPRVASALGVERLHGRPVALPISILTQSIGKLRAHLYAAFHSGRKKANPISRAALTTISQVSSRTQQNYERRTGVRKQRNYATGPKLKSDQAQELAWHKGSAAFIWHDRQGKHGSSTAKFLAWQLPNSYSGPHEQRSNGNRKKFNRQLADLSDKGMTGNGRPAVEFMAKRYCDTAKVAAQSASNCESAVYWRGSQPGIWYVMERCSTGK